MIKWITDDVGLICEDTEAEEPVAVCYRNPNYPQKLVANARLIAAAPEMRRALKSLLDLAEVGADYTGADTDRALIAEARAVLAQAGEPYEAEDVAT